MEGLSKLECLSLTKILALSYIKQQGLELTFTVGYPKLLHMGRFTFVNLKEILVSQYYRTLHIDTEGKQN